MSKTLPALLGLVVLTVLLPLAHGQEDRTCTVESVLSPGVDLPFYPYRLKRVAHVG